MIRKAFISVLSFNITCVIADAQSVYEAGTLQGWRNKSLWLHKKKAFSVMGCEVKDPNTEIKPKNVFIGL